MTSPLVVPKTRSSSRHFSSPGQDYSRSGFMTTYAGTFRHSNNSFESDAFKTTRASSCSP